MNNYFSVGVDASIALRFHNERLNKPNKFRSRSVTIGFCLNFLIVCHSAKNKLFYAQYGAAEAFSSTCADLHKQIVLLCDGHEVALPPLEGIAILNIPRYLDK